MTNPLNIPRLLGEIVAAIAVAEAGVMFILPLVAPGVSEAVGALLDATMLSLLAGPVILWRVVAASKRAARVESVATWRLMLTVVGVLVCGVAASGLAMRSVQSQIDAEARARFDRLAERLATEAERRINLPVYGLKGARGVYAASKSVERGEFRSYVASRNLGNEFPGALGFGFIKHVQRAELDAFVAFERADEAPEFAVHGVASPGSGLENASDLYVVKFIEPLDDNAAAFGYDIGSEPVRRAAAERAVATGEPTVTGKVSLVQDGERRSGLLYMVPVYKNGMQASTPQERLAALDGIVFAPISFEKAFATLADAADGQLDFEVFDGPTPTASNKLFDYDPSIDAAAVNAGQSNGAGLAFSRRRTVTVGGRPWTLVAGARPAFEATIDRSTPALVGVAGSVLSLLLAAVLWTMGTSRARAVRLADSMTADLSAAKAAADRLADIAKHTSNAVVITDVQGRIEWVNEGFTRISGYTLQEVKGKQPASFLQGAESDQSASRQMGEAVRRGEGCRAEIVNYGKDGRGYTLAIEMTPLRDEAGALTGYMAIESDISERKAADAALAASEAKVRAIIDASPVPMAINEHDRITFVNPAFIRTFGYDLTDIPTLADWWPKAYPDETYRAHVARSWQAELERSARTGEAFIPVELRIRSKSGAEVVAMANAEPIRDGSQGAVLVMLYDITERKRTELALARATAMLERTGELAKVGGWSVDLASMKLSWTLQTFRIAEIEPPNEPDLETGLNLFAPEARPVVTAAVQAAMDNGTPYDLEVPLITAKGNHRWVKTQGYAEMSDGKAIRLYGTFQDITEVRRAETELKEVNERFQMATHAGGVGTWDYDLLTQHVSWDEQMFRLWGITKNQFASVYEAWLAGVHPEDRARCDELAQAAIRGEREFDTEFRIVWPCGSIRYIRSLGTVQRDAAGQPLRMVGTNWDVTEQKRAAEATRDAEELLRSAIDSLDSHTVVLDSDGKMLSVNRAWREFAAGNGGIGGTFCEGANYLAVCDKAASSSRDASRVAAALRSVLAGEGDPAPIEYPCHAPGQRRWFMCSIRGFARGGKRFAVVSHLNITPVKQAEAELVQARHAAEAASQAKSAFLANMSHEIRTPLTAILGFADLLREDGYAAGDPAQRLATVETIRSAGNHLLTVINDILDLSKIEADKMTVERIETPVTAVLREVASLMRPRATGKGLTLTATLAMPLPERIISDPTRLRQILMNLMGNSVKFTESGSVTISAGAIEHEGVSKLVIDVEDTGTGMTPDQAGRLFTAFSQADETVTRKHGGTGLGLTICRRLAALMGGDVKLLRTEPGKGSCFRLVLPLEAVPGSAMVYRLDAVTDRPGPERADAKPALAGRILLAEDGADNQRLIAFHLRRAGAEVVIADNGRVALEMLESAAAEGRAFDLILTDMQMPEMDGYTLARTLRQRGSTMPIVALTAHAMAEDRAKCTDAGCDDYASKPIDKAALLATCGKWMGQVGGRTTAEPAA